MPRHFFWLLYIALTVSFILFWLNIFFPTIRFLSPLLSYAFFILVGPIIPSLLIAVVLFFQKKQSPLAWTMAILHSLFWGVLAAASSLLALFASFNVGTLVERGTDPLFQRIESVSVGRTQVVSYYTNCGAFCGDGIEVRHEKQILPGFKFVRRLYTEDREYRVDIDVDSDTSIRIDGQHIPLRRNIYF